MLLGYRSLLLSVCALLLVSGCGSSSYSNSSGSINPPSGGTGGTGGGPTGNPIGGSSGPTGSNDLVVATPSVAGSVSVVVGAQQTVSITFSSSDGSAISGFGISGSLGTALPADWSGPGGLTCASISTGSGCVLNLTYAPTAVGSGTVTVDYVYVDNATMPSTGGSLTIAYAATAHNNVVAAASPTGQIDAVAGGGDQPVSVNFTTDDGNAATGLTLTTDLSALPAGWSTTATSLSCAIVSTGSGCQLPLTYTPTAAARGTLTLNYSYTDDSGTIKTGALNIPYSTSSPNDVIAAASPSGEINAIEKSGGQAVAVTFTTNDGKPATGVYLASDLAALPPGWSSSSKSFACGSVSTGNGCQLHLTYAPAALTKGTLVLNYAYTDAAGMAKSGSLNVAYAATTNDNVVATASPTGQINAVVGMGTQAVAVTFTTDDGRPATALQLTSSLSSLPPAWSSTATSFSCSGLSSGSGCQLPLTYAPTAAGSGMLSLSYAYKNDAGVAKTGSLNIAYRATTNDNIVGTASQNPLAVITNSSTTVSLVFTTDDQNPASNLVVTSGLALLPSGWSSTSSGFTCSAVSTGTGCQLGLTYAPMAVGRGTMSLNYSYNDDSGTAKTGSVNIPYTAMSPPHLYVAQLGGLLSHCVFNADGTLSSCAPTGDGFTAPTGIVFNGGNFAYVADNNTSNAVYLCNVGLDGSLSGCSPTGSKFQTPWQLAISGTTLYATNLTSGVTTCAINPDGTLTGCTPSPGTGTSGVAASSGHAYIGSGPNVLDVCAIGVLGSLSGCTSTGSGFVGLDGISLSGGYAYVANENGGSVSVCSIDASGGLSSCATYNGVGVAPSDVVISGNQAYINDASSGNVYLCSVAAATTGALANCIIANAGNSFSAGIQIAIH
jgi:LVIVD repeat